MENEGPRVNFPHDVIHPTRIGDPGGPTRGQAPGPNWRSTFRGWYVPSDTPRDVPEQRILEAAALVRGGGAVTGWASLRLQGAGYFDGKGADRRTPVPVTLALGRGQIRPRPGIRLLREALDDSEIAVIHGARCTKAPRALFDEMRGVDLREAVVAMDMAAAAELTSVRRQTQYTLERTGTRGATAALRALELADNASASPNETRLRLIWVLDALLPRPLVNAAIFDDRGDLLGVADLFDPDAGVVGEFDGRLHRGAHRHTRDLDRDDRFRRAGLEVFRVTGLDLLHRDRVVNRMREAFARPRSNRPTWTLEAPEDWRPGWDLETLLDIRDWEVASTPDQKGL